jgi:hypothetical protein
MYALKNGKKKGGAMVVTLNDISAETAQALTAQAAAYGLTIDDYLKLLLGLNDHELAKNGALADEEVTASLQEFGEDVPPLPRNFSRADIYFPED